MSDAAIRGGAFSIQINGARLPTGVLAAVSSITVEQRINLPSAATVRINPVDFDTKSTRVADLDGYALGSPMVVSLGRNQVAEVFSGQIAAFEPTLTGACREIEVSGYDKLFRLGFGTNARVFEDRTDSMIVSEVVQAAGLTADTEETSGTYPYVLQNNVSDFRFILSRAMRINYEVSAAGDTIQFRRSRAGEQAALTLEYGVSLDEFTMRLRALSQGSQVTRIGWDPKQKQAIVQTVSSGEPDDLMGGDQTGFQASTDLASSPNTAPDTQIVDETTAQSSAEGARETFLDGFQDGVAECPGDPRLKPGINVAVTKVDGRFNGLYYVIGARHSYSYADGYRTRLELRRTGV